MRQAMRWAGLLMLALAGACLGQLAALLVACAIAGTSASRFVLDRITDANFRLVTQRLVLALGACYGMAGVWLLS